MVWDIYLTNTPEQLQSLAVISDYHQSPRLTISPRATLRAKWQIVLANLLNSLPRQDDPSNFYSQPSVEHQSELIRRIVPWDNSMPSMFVDAIDVFTVKYLLEVQTGLTLDFGVRQDKVDDINGRPGDENE